MGLNPHIPPLRRGASASLFTVLCLPGHIWHVKLKTRVHPVRQRWVIKRCGPRSKESPFRVSSLEPLWVMPATPPPTPLFEDLCLAVLHKIHLFFEPEGHSRARPLAIRTRLPGRPSCGVKLQSTDHDSWLVFMPTLVVAVNGLISAWYPHVSQYITDPQWWHFFAYAVWVLSWCVERTHCYKTALVVPWSAGQLQVSL